MAYRDDKTGDIMAYRDDKTGDILHKKSQLAVIKQPILPLKHT